MPIPTFACITVGTLVVKAGEGTDLTWLAVTAATTVKKQKQQQPAHRFLSAAHSELVLPNRAAAFRKRVALPAFVTWCYGLRRRLNPFLFLGAIAYTQGFFFFYISYFIFDYHISFFCLYTRFVFKKHKRPSSEGQRDATW